MGHSLKSFPETMEGTVCLIWKSICSFWPWVRLPQLRKLKRKTPMFDLEHRITEWRRRMLAGGVQSATVLDELETHLREDIGRATKSGHSVEQAFEIAVQSLGNAEGIAAEFRKTVRA